MNKPHATKTEVLLAIAMSGYYQTTHVHYMPVGKRFTKTLMKMRSTGNITPMGENFYKLTKKGREFLVRQNVALAQDVDKQIDEFISKL